MFPSELGGYFSENCKLSKSDIDFVVSEVKEMGAVSSIINIVIKSSRMNNLFR